MDLNLSSLQCNANSFLNSLTYERRHSNTMVELESIREKLTAESEKGQRNLEEAHARVGELEQKLNRWKL